jgi:hypothetical protein
MMAKTAKPKRTKYVVTLVVETDPPQTKGCIAAWIKLGLATGRWVDERHSDSAPVIKAARVRSVDFD